MTNSRKFDHPSIYAIWIKGHLDRQWSDWFDGFTMIDLENDETVLTGPVNDQAALHGLLAKLRDLGLPILLVKRLEGNEQLS